MKRSITTKTLIVYLIVTMVSLIALQSNRVQASEQTDNSNIEYAWYAWGDNPTEEIGYVGSMFDYSRQYITLSGRIRESEYRENSSNKLFFYLGTKNNLGNSIVTSNGTLSYDGEKNMHGKRLYVYKQLMPNLTEMNLSYQSDKYKYYTMSTSFELANLNNDIENITVDIGVNYELETGSNKVLYDIIPYEIQLEGEISSDNIIMDMQAEITKSIEKILVENDIEIVESNYYEDGEFGSYVIVKPNRNSDDLVLIAGRFEPKNGEHQEDYAYLYCCNCVKTNGENGKNWRKARSDYGEELDEKIISINPKYIYSTVDNNTNVKITFTNDTMDLAENEVDVNCTEITDEAKLERFKVSLGDSTNKIVAYDINLLSNGVKVQPNGKVKISIPIPNGFNRNNLYVARIDEDGTVTKYDVTINGDYAEFETNHFSDYVLAEDKDKTSSADTNEYDSESEDETADSESENSTEENKKHILDKTPKTGENSLIEMIISFMLKIKTSI